MKRAQRIIILILITLLAIIFATEQQVDVLFLRQNWNQLDASVLAAWVQAIGSIAAIIGAFSIANQQHLKDLRVQKANSELAKQERYAIVWSVLKRVEVRLQSAAFSRDTTVTCIADSERIAKLRATSLWLDAIPPFEMPGPKILRLCLSIHTHIHDVADILERERLEAFTPRGRPDGVEDEIAELKNLLTLAMTLCINLSEGQLS